MDTANFINIEVGVYYSSSKHNIFCTKAVESFNVWFVKETRLVNRQRISSTQISKTLTFTLYTKTMQMAQEKVAEVSYCY